LLSNHPLYYHLFQNVLKGFSLRVFRKKREAKVDGFGGVGLKGKDVSDGGDRRGERVFCETDCGFGDIDGLTRPLTILIKARIDAAGFSESSFAKNEQVICKQKVVDRRAIFRNFEAFDSTFFFCLKQQPREDFSSNDEQKWGYRITLSQASFRRDASEGAAIQQKGKGCRGDA
jgi:hypothetical protein